MKDKLKVVIFGTGWAFRNFIKNYRDDYDIIGITDWEYKDHGTEIEGIPVVNIYELASNDYDYILLLSFYVNEIKAQLWDNCKIGEDRIIIPPKYKIKHGKPFEHEETANFARKAIFYFTDLAKKYNIKLFLDYGTLLGFVRDGDIIKWDDDVDFSINHEDIDVFVKMIKENINNFPYSDILNWTVTQRVTQSGEIRSISLIFKNKKSIKIQEFEIGIRVRQTFNNLSVVMYLDYLACDKIHFAKCDSVSINNKELCVPYNPKKYLKHVYGEWETPAEIDFGFKEGNFNTDHLASYKVELTDKPL